MFAWIDLFWFAGGVALGVVGNAKIMTFIHGAEGYVAKLEAQLAALKAKLVSAKATVQADVGKATATVQADVNAVKGAAAAVEKKA